LKSDSHYIIYGEPMNKIKCPQCESGELELIGNSGCIEYGQFVEVHECRECNMVFDVKAEFINVQIK